MGPVALLTAVPRSEDDSDAGMESPLRTRTAMNAEGDADPEMERPL